MEIEYRYAQRALTFALTFLCATGAQAGLLAIDTTGGYNATSGQGVSRGNSFTLTEAFLIDGLGFFDADADGLGESHDVGIFAADGSLVLGAVAISDSSPLVSSGSTLGDWRVESVDPFLLAAGDYVIAGYNATGVDQIPITDTFVDIPQVVRTASLYDFTDSLALPTTQTIPPSFSWSNVTFTGTATGIDPTVPEPATLALFSIGLAGIGYRWRKQIALA